MKHDELVELAKKAVQGNWAQVRVRPVEGKHETASLDLLIASGDLFAQKKKMNVRFGDSNGKEIFVIVAGGRIPKGKIEIGIRHAHRFNSTSPKGVKVEVWADGDMTVRTYFPLPDGTDLWNEKFGAHVRTAAAAIARIDDIDWERTPVPRVRNCTPERILYEVNGFGLSEYLAWIEDDGGVVVSVDEDVHGNEQAIHRPRFSVGDFDLVWETCCEKWQLEDIAAALSFANRYNAKSVDAMAFVDEKARRLVWRRAFRRMPSEEELFAAVNDGTSFFIDADKVLCGEGVQTGISA